MKITKKEIILLILFIAIVSFSIIKVKNNLQENEKDKEIEQVLTEGLKEDTTTDSNKQADNTKVSTNEEIKLTENAIAVLTIPSVNIKGLVVEGTSNAVLKNYIGKFKGSANPGQVGNFSVAAHNNICTELFKNLHNVKNGDEINIKTKTNEYTYKVTSIQTIDPTQTEVINSSTKKEITLITCNYNATKRIVVKGILV